MMGRTLAIPIYKTLLCFVISLTFYFVVPAHGIRVGNIVVQVIIGMVKHKGDMIG